MGEETKKRTVLVMDDDTMVGDIASQMLEFLGFDCVLTTDGTEAIEQFRTRHGSATPFDLVIMDLTIPGGVGGEEAIADILQIDPEAKVIVSSGYSSDPVMDNFSEYGFVAAIAKPFDMEGLKTLVTEVLGS